MSSSRVMVVDDEPTVAIDLCDCLTDLGYDVVSVEASGEDAIEEAGRKRPDVVLMDIHLRDDMDGIESAEKIHDRFGVPVVFLSAYSDVDLLDRAKRVGSFAYLVKPFNERELYAAIEMAVYRSRIDRERETLIAELNEALEQVKTLRGIIPICSHCKKIRDDKGCWHRVEEYVSAHSEAVFSHSICVTCMEGLYPTP